MTEHGPNSSLSSLHLLEQLRTPGSRLRSELCIAVSTVIRCIAKEQQRALAQVCRGLPIIRGLFHHLPSTIC
jgi:hypothetical protein